MALQERCIVLSCSFSARCSEVFKATNLIRLVQRYWHCSRDSLEIILLSEVHFDNIRAWTSGIRGFEMFIPDPIFALKSWTELSILDSTYRIVSE